MRSGVTKAALRAAIVLAFATVVLRSAWMCDDAYITLRTVDNWVHGFGLRWNVAERVQTFTHPLWMLVLSAAYAVTREAYLTPIAVSTAFAAAALWVALARPSVRIAAMLLASSPLIFSKAFVEFSTSGLENPLSYFLIALFVSADDAEGENKVLPRLCWTCCLLLLNRLDLFLLVAPRLALELWRSPSTRTMRTAAVAFSPLIAWELFSLVYYGALVPNTAYAKLQNGIPATALAGQGGLYLLDALQRDPVTVLGLVTGPLLAMIDRKPNRLAHVGGIVLYLVYVVSIGGDFMTGRFLSAPLFLSACVIAGTPLAIRPFVVAPYVTAAAALGVFATARPPILTTAHTFDQEPRGIFGVGGIDDERAFYSRYTGLLRYTRAVPLPHHAEEVWGREARGTRQVIVTTGIGIFGFFAGPDVHLVDPLALGDPLLARLPPRPEPKWRIGHFERDVPSGYVSTLETGTNTIRDPEIRALYDKISLVTRGPLWSWRRWRAIMSLQLDRRVHPAVARAQLNR